MSHEKEEEKGRRETKVEREQRIEEDEAHTTKQKRTESHGELVLLYINGVAVYFWCALSKKIYLKKIIKS